MTPERWARLKELFAAAAEAGEAERGRQLEALRREDPELAGELEGLLAADRGEDPNETATVWLGVPSAAHDAAEWPGRIDRYRILGELGRGGMGRVFLAERADGAYRQKVALKVLSGGRLASADAQRRFVAERQILARLAHPAIAQLVDGGTTAEGEPFLVTEYVDGRPIDVACREDALGGTAIVRLFLGVCEAVEAAHRSLVVHRDLKPSNILVTADRKPKLLDFGIAKLLDPAFGGEGDAEVVETRRGHAPLTPRYASPEQVRGEPVTVATDVYSLGVVLYELLTGASPYGEATGSAAALARAICERDPRPPSTVVTGAPSKTTGDASAGRHPSLARRWLAGDLDAIVLKALRKDPGDRYGSVAELGGDLRRYLDGLPVAARRGSRLYRFGKFARRNRWPLATAAAAVILLAAFAFERDRQLRAVAQERDKAREVAELMIDIFSVADPSEERGDRMPVREVLDAGATRLDRELAGQPEIRASLLETIGRVDHRLGRVRAARPLLDRAVELRRGLGDRVELARALKFRGETAEVGGDPDQAAKDYREGLAQLADEAGERALAADLQSALGRLELDRGRYPEAARWLAQALETGRERKAAEAADPLQTAATLIALAVAEQLQGQPERAAPRRDQAERLLRGAGRKDPVGEGQLLNDLAMAHQIAGDPERAHRLIEEAVARLRGGLDGDHAEIANALNNRGLMESELGRHEEAERTFREALAMWRRLVGDDHARTALAVGNLGAVLRRQKDWAGAEPLLREGLRLDRKLLPPDSPDIATDHRNLGDVLRELGRLAEAEAEYQAALELELRVLGDASGPAAQTRLALGRLREAQGRRAEAFELADRAIGTLRRLHPDGHPRLAEALAWRGRLAAEDGRLDAARTDLEEALRFQEAHLPADHPDLARTRSRLEEVRSGRAAAVKTPS